jgi:tRNA A58 N-methylase Trm61|tara:strand:+ start:268 stop:567 length:300 start_codon:yes stop_codon:yes gene_type:complete
MSEEKKPIESYALELLKMISEDVASGKSTGALINLPKLKEEIEGQLKIIKQDSKDLLETIEKLDKAETTILDLQDDKETLEKKLKQKGCLLCRILRIKH